MKVSERIFEQDGKLIHQRTNDYTQEAEQVKRLKDQGLGDGSDYKLVGRLPVPLIYEWCQEAGVSFDDVHAVQEIIKKKMLSGDFDKFRVWEGRY